MKGPITKEIKLEDSENAISESLNRLEKTMKFISRLPIQS